MLLLLEVKEVEEEEEVEVEEEKEEEEEEGEDVKKDRVDIASEYCFNLICDDDIFINKFVSCIEFTSCLVVVVVIGIVDIVVLLLL